MTGNIKAKQTVIAWGMGILLWINLLTIGLSTLYFGYIDWSTVAKMFFVAFPPLAVGAVLLNPFRPAPEATQKPRPRLATAINARAGR